MESGTKVSSKVMESGKESKMILILVNGNLLKLTDMVFIIGQMVIDMKDSGKCA